MKIFLFLTMAVISFISLTIRADEYNQKELREWVNKSPVFIEYVQNVYEPVSPPVYFENDKIPDKFWNVLNCKDFYKNKNARFVEVKIVAISKQEVKQVEAQIKSGQIKDQLKQHPLPAYKISVLLGSPTGLNKDARICGMTPGGLNY